MIPESPFDPTLRHGALRGHRFSYTDDGGDGPTVVCVHGLPGSVRDYRWLGSAIATRSREARVIRLDMPGFGQTDAALTPGMRLDERAAFVANALSVLALTDVTLVGHSMGGPVAIGAAALAPARVSKLCLLASVGLTPHRGYREMPHPPLLSKVVCSPLGRRFLPDQVRKTFVAAGFPSSTPVEELFTTLRIIGALRFTDIRSYAERVQARGIDTQLFITEDDRLVEVAIGEALAAGLGAKLRAFPEGGHNIQKSQAMEIAAALLPAAAAEPARQTA